MQGGRKEPHPSRRLPSHGLLPAGLQMLTKPFELNTLGQKVQTLGQVCKLTRLDCRLK
jgi:hypothetical protein